VIVYKVDILSVLKNKGYNTNRIRKEKILGERTLQNLRHNEYISLKSLDIICKLLQCDISDLIEYQDTQDTPPEPDTLLT
jgi:putative transcriptional regulator